MIHIKASVFRLFSDPLATVEALSVLSMPEPNNIGLRVLSGHAAKTRPAASSKSGM